MRVRDVIMSLMAVDPRLRATNRLVEESSEWGYIMAHCCVRSSWGIRCRART